MSNSLLAIRQILFNYIHEDEKIFGEIDSLDGYVLQGTSYAGVLIGRTYFSLADNLIGKKVEEIDTPKLGNLEIRLASVCAYREFALNFHHTLTKKATNFKSNKFSVAGMTERAKEAMRIVWWCDTQISSLIDSIQKHGIPDADPPMEAGGDFKGILREMGFENHHFVY